MSFLGLFGGDKQTTVTNQATTVNVTTNPQVNVGVDTQPIADAVSQVAAQDRALVGQVADNGTQQASTLADALNNQAAGFVQLGRELAIFAGAGLLIFFLHKRA